MSRVSLTVPLFVSNFYCFEDLIIHLTLLSISSLESYLFLGYTLLYSKESKNTLLYGPFSFPNLKQIKFRLYKGHLLRVYTDLLNVLI